VTARSADLVRDLQQRVRLLEDDLRSQADRLPEVDRRLRDDYAAAQKRGRVGEAWTSWLDAQVSQAAVAWVLGCVFVRFCEDNDLTDQRWIAGPGDGLALAVDAQAAWIQAHPRENDRDWLRQAFTWLRSTRAGASLFSDTDFVWWWDVSADAAEALIGFFRRRGGEGDLVHRFDSPDWDTRFLGDLYQDLSEAARKRYALLQTPEFVEEFILDRTLDPALEEFGVEDFRMIDPTCGSGHFLLGGFRRLLDSWAVHAPAMDPRTRVQKALDAVWGVDINTAATAIAKFRLTVAALRSAGARRLDSPDAPAFTLHIGTGDSLIWGSGGRQTAMTFEETDPLGEHHYAWEDLDQHPHILERSRYQVVVGNPPYITVKDKALNQAYRDRYETCHRQYALSVPFAELFFRLAIYDSDRPGHVGQITSNSFMKREFGKKLIEDFFPNVDLTHVIDTSGAYIPGHGTPTVVLIGRRRIPRSDTVRTVLGIRGEPSAPADPAKGLVWTSMVENVETPGAATEYMSVTDLPRARLVHHPWSLSGGGASELFASLETHGKETLAAAVDMPIGRAVRTGSDDAFFRPQHVIGRMAASAEAFRPFLEGSSIRDWSKSCTGRLLYPYGLRPEVEAAATQVLWPWRTALAARTTFQGNMADAGLPWWHYMQHTASAYAWPRAITFAEIATHNHFVFERDGWVVTQTAPVIKLPEGTSEDDHLRLLGLLNSSTACFWLKQACFNKGGDHVGTEGARVSKSAWEDRFAFNSTKVGEFPLPAEAPMERTRRLDTLAQELVRVTPTAVHAADVPTRDALDEARRGWEAIRGEMVAVQEELDWEVYRLYGILDHDLTSTGDDLPRLALGERAFEIVLARKMVAGEVETQWFARHRSMPTTEIPAHWPAAYRDLVQRRIEVIESHPMLHLIERPECKRRWAIEPWEKQQAEALRDWLLDRLEADKLWRDDHGPRTLSVAQLADAMRADTEFRQVLDLDIGRPDYDLTKEVGRLIKDEVVPYLAAHRYKASGMRKRVAWEETWVLQRKEDAGEEIDPIPVPPKYTGADFRATSFWRARGKLDVPKERFVSYPGTERTGDTTAVLGWAGWDHLQRAQALTRLILDRQTNEGWDATQVKEPLAGLLELERWLHQWHTDPDPVYGGSPAGYYTTFLDEQIHTAGLTRADLAPLAAPD